MKLLSTRTRAKLWKLQDSVREAADERYRVVELATFCTRHDELSSN